MEWDKYFIEMLQSVKLKSKDPNTQVGAIIVGQHNNIISTGYNGFPRLVLDDKEAVRVRFMENDWIYPKSVFDQKRIDKNEEVQKRYDKPNKYLWTEHAERNAIYNAARHGIALEYSKIYIDWLPCARCARAIIQSGITSIVVDARDYEAKEKKWLPWKDDMQVALTMLEESKIYITYWKE